MNLYEKFGVTDEQQFNLYGDCELIKYIFKVADNKLYSRLRTNIDDEFTEHNLQSVIDKFKHYGSCIQIVPIKPVFAIKTYKTLTVEKHSNSNEYKFLIADTDIFLSENEVKNLIKALKQSLKK